MWSVSSSDTLVSSRSPVPPLPNEAFPIPSLAEYQKKILFFDFRNSGYRLLTLTFLSSLDGQGVSSWVRVD